MDLENQKRVLALAEQHADTIKRIEKQYGVPGAVVVAIWGLETDYGVNQGKMSVVRTSASITIS